MIFWFKNKKIVVDALVSEQFVHAYENAPIDYTEKFYPEWWKSLPKTSFDFKRLDRINESMRLCSGFLEHYDKGMVVPMWSDLAIKTKEEIYEYQFSDGMSGCEHHQKSQRKGFWDSHMNLKIISPWLLKSEKNVSFTFLPPIWNFPVKPNFEIAIGTVNFYYQHASHINLLIENNQEIFIPFRQPILHIIPLSERRLKLRKQLVSASEFEKQRNRAHQVSFIGSYQKVKKYKEKKEKRKCPFSF